MNDSEADPLALVRADREAQNRRKAEQAAVEVEGHLEALCAAKRCRAQPTDDKINDAFKRATSC